MPPAENKFPLSTTQIIIIVVAVLIGVVLIGSAISICLNRRRKRRQRKNVQYLNPKLRGGADDEAEVVEFMKAGSFDSTHLASCELDSSRPPCELGYSTRPLSEVPRTLQPGQSNTALPAYSPMAVVNNGAPTTTVELEDTSRRELPLSTSDEDSTEDPIMKPNTPVTPPLPKSMM
ncbi:hypothetical protein BST61_g969 [Cercospora zeina]